MSMTDSESDTQIATVSIWHTEQRQLAFEHRTATARVRVLKLEHRTATVSIWTQNSDSWRLTHRRNSNKILSWIRGNHSISLVVVMKKIKIIKMNQALIEIMIVTGRNILNHSLRNSKIGQRMHLLIIEYLMLTDFTHHNRIRISLSVGRGELNLYGYNWGTNRTLHKGDIEEVLILQSDLYGYKWGTNQILRRGKVIEEILILQILQVRWQSKFRRGSWVMETQSQFNIPNAEIWIKLFLISI